MNRFQQYLLNLLFNNLYLLNTILNLNVYTRQIFNVKFYIKELFKFIERLWKLSSSISLDGKIVKSNRILIYGIQERRNRNRDSI